LSATVVPLVCSRPEPPRLSEFSYSRPEFSSWIGEAGQGNSDAIPQNENRDARKEGRTGQHRVVLKVQLENRASLSITGQR
jgi:hypothetical protein